MHRASHCIFYVNYGQFKNKINKTEPRSKFTGSYEKKPISYIRTQDPQKPTELRPELMVLKKWGSHQFTSSVLCLLTPIPDPQI